ncbi:MAG TPA: hypothetical protein VJL78_08450 [Candidatus Nitrosocosmicus sp.]|nr:hypothetical protein [Candidatus Nitrosocosmicus sp.]
MGGPLLIKPQVSRTPQHRIRPTPSIHSKTYTIRNQKFEAREAKVFLKV